MPCAFGTVVGWPAPTMTSLQTPSSPISVQLTAKQASLLGSLTFAGGIFGTLIWSRIADNFGRKAAGYCVGGIFIIGWAVIEFTSDTYSLFVARFILGISGTGSLIMCPLYISEIADDKIRGTLGSLAILFMNIGTLCSYVFGAAFSYRILTGICLVIPIVFVVLFIWLPETPGYLWRTGERRKAESALHRLRGGNFTKVQEEIIKFAHLEATTRQAGCLTLFSTRGNKMGMLIGLGLFSGQQFCGILALLTYTTIIFQQSGSTLNSDMATVLVGAFQLVASFISALIVEKTGRKILLLISFLCMGITLTILGVFFYLKQYPTIDTGSVAWLPLVMLSLYVIAYSLGVGPLPYVVMTEVLSPEIRALASSVIIFWGTTLTFIAVQIFPFLVMSIGNHGNFWFFAAFSFLSFAFTLFVVPETKGVPLADILAKLNGKTLTNP